MAETPAATAAPETPAGTPAGPATPPSQTPEQIRAEALAQFAAQLKDATGHESVAALKAASDQAEAERLRKAGEFEALAKTAAEERDLYKQRFESATVRSVLVGAAANAVDAEVVHDLLASRATVGDDGAVTIDGKPAADAVAALLAAKPYLAKSAGTQGSGVGGGTGAAKSMPRSAFQKLSPTDRAAHMRTGGTVVEG